MGVAHILLLVGHDALVEQIQVLDLSMLAVGKVSEIVLWLSVFITPDATKSLIYSTFHFMEAERCSVLSMERCIGATDDVPKLGIAGPIFWL